MNDDESSERLQKVLARAGFGSRRVCDDLISSGRVSVNDKRAELGQRVDSSADLVAVDGVPIGILPGLVHYLLNKPRGVVTTASDPQGRSTVVDLVPDDPRVFSVGRLDADTEGLLIMTNDGALAQRLTHPSFGVEKEYLVHLKGAPTRASLRSLREGVDLEDGLTAPAKVGVVGEVAAGVLKIAIHEGRNRQVRRMFDAVGHPVLRLVRVRVGPVSLRNLEPGGWRALSAKEVRALWVAASETGPGTRRRDPSPRTSARRPEGGTRPRR